MPSTVPLRETLYEVMVPPVSVDAFQLIWMDDDEVAAAVTLPGVEGVAVLAVGV